MAVASFDCTTHETVIDAGPVHVEAEQTKRIPSELERYAMLWTIFIILLILWLLGIVSSYTFGGFIHILLLIAVVVLVIRLIQGRRVV